MNEYLSYRFTDRKWQQITIKFGIDLLIDLPLDSRLSKLSSLQERQALPSRSLTYLT